MPLNNHVAIVPAIQPISHDTSYMMAAGGGRIGIMDMPETVIRPVTTADLLTITRMTFNNMTGVDRHFTRITRNPLRRLAEYMKMPVYLALAGQGYKAVRDRQTVGCAFLHFRHVSAYVFNVSVNRPYRRQGMGRQLMEHLESVARQRDHLWLALQVDDGNEPAQQLYKELGYRTYHPHFMRRAGGTSLFRAVTTGLAVESLSRYQGGQLFRRYHNTEVQTGDLWAAPILNDYETAARSGGRFWRCSLNGREIGCAWISGRDRNLQLRLACQPDYWGHVTTGGLVKRLLDEGRRTPAEIELYLASSAHHRAAEPLLTSLGFESRSQWRMLMFKSIEEAT